MALEPQFTKSIPDGDNRRRRVCDHCGFVQYDNPRVIVGAIVRHGDKVLLCRRAIHPRKGYWTIPAGFMELGETPDAGARREAYEEACAVIETGDLLAVYTIAHLSQVQIFYRAILTDPAIAAGDESLEVGLFGWDEIPWDDIAFPSVTWALEHDRDVHSGKATAPFENPRGETGAVSE